MLPLNAGERRLNLITVFLYGFIVVFLSASHEVWRDEVRALSIAMESGSIIDLFHHLRNEGHPALWYLLLYAGYGVAHNTVILKVINVVIAIAAISLFLWEAPFSRIQRVLFVFGYFVLCEYSVLNRSYSLSMLLLFIFCSLYRSRFERMGMISVVLFLLANTNAHSMIIVTAIGLSLLAEFVWKVRSSGCDAGHARRIVIGFCIIAVGIALSAVQAYPDRTTVATGMYTFRWNTLLKVLTESILLPGNSQPFVLGVFGPESGVFVTIILWFCYVCFLKRPFILMILFSGTVGLGMLSSLVYKAQVWHQGLLFLLIVAVFWLDASEEKDKSPAGTERESRFAFFNDPKKIILYVLLSLQAGEMIPGVGLEISRVYSSSKDFAVYLKGHPDLRNAIIIGEPDYFLESLPYYADNPIYFPREQRFGKTIQFTTANTRSFSLGDLLGVAEKLINQYNRPVLIIIGHELGPDGPFKRRFIHGRDFTYSRESLALLKTHTTNLVGFHRALCDENYDVFRVG